MHQFLIRILIRWFTVAAAVLSTAAVIPNRNFAQEPHSTSSKQAEHLKRFLQVYLRDPVEGDVKGTRYVSAFVDLTGDGRKEAIVYVMDDPRQYWCGSGGCTMLILAAKGSSFRVVARLTATWPPVRVLRRKSLGWHDIGVWTQGGGIQPGYEADFYFNGKTYRGRDAATLRPSKRLQERVLPGETVIGSTALQQAKRLYPELHP